METNKSMNATKLLLTRVYVSDRMKVCKNFCIRTPEKVALIASSGKKYLVDSPAKFFSSITSFKLFVRST